MLQEVLQVIPLRLFSYFAVAMWGSVLLELFVVEAAHFRAATRWNVYRCMNDEVHGHPGRASHQNADGAHVADELGNDLDLLVAPGLGKFDLFHWRATIDDRELIAQIFVHRLGARK